MDRTEKIERKIVSFLIDAMRTRGWRVVEVFDGESRRDCATTEQCLGHVFAVGDSQLVFENAAGRQHRVELYCETAFDIIGDYDYATDRSDNFYDVMTKVVEPAVELIEFTSTHLPAPEVACHV